MVPVVETYETKAGARVHRLPMELFPGFWGYAHLVVADPWVLLVDVGSGFGDSNQHLQEGLRQVAEMEGPGFGWASITHVLISHGHIDHFGGLGFVREQTRAPVGIHELDRRVLVNYEQRLIVVAHRLQEYLAETGVAEARRAEIMGLYLLNKHLFASMPVDFTFEAAGMQIGAMPMLHVPGHCPGHVLLRVDDLLLAGDHVLPRTSPHQSPERLSHFTGLGHYLDSLERMLAWAGPVRLTLGGHEGPIPDLRARADAIRELHANRLDQVQEFLSEPHTIAEVSDRLFPGVHGYDMLLALEEAGAHVEHLEQRGLLGVANLSDLESEAHRPISYIRLEGAAAPRERVRRPDCAGSPARR